jgi:alkyl sulfatase BDS1-like metallo-beta-lactamase superfamily hydrolase
MGGEAAVMAIGRKAVADGDYRWAVELMNHAVFANPDNAEARGLQADALEQLGYQAESATWRNAYLMGAFELRAGPQKISQSTSGPDVVRGMTNELLWDYVALRLDHQKTDGLKANISVEFTDVNEVWALELSNSVLNSTKGRVLRNPDLKVTMTRPAFLAMVVQGKKLRELAQAGLVKIDGDPTGAIENNVLTFEPLFPIVAP